MSQEDGLAAMHAAFLLGDVAELAMAAKHAEDEDIRLQASRMLCQLRAPDGAALCAEAADLIEALVASLPVSPAVTPLQKKSHFTLSYLCIDYPAVVAHAVAVGALEAAVAALRVFSRCFIM
jgi:hypothetical protein